MRSRRFIVRLITIENKETPRGDGNLRSRRFIVRLITIENKETPRGDGNIYLYVQSTKYPYRE